MLLSSLLTLLAAVSYVFASFPGSYDSQLDQLPARLSRLLPQGLPSYVLSLYSPVHAHSPSCLRDASLYVKALQGFQPWALHMLDASSKPPSGVLMGHTHDLGNYDQCLSTASPHFSTQHCLVEFLGIVPTPRLLHPDWDTTIGGLPLLKEPKLSFCLPASCGIQDVEAHFSHVADHWNVTVRVDRFSCSRRESTPFDTLDWIAIFVLSTLVGLALSSTAYDLLNPCRDEGFWHSLLVSFSLLSNGRRLLSTIDPHQSLTYMGGLRFLSMVWIIFGHHMVLQFLIPSHNWIYLYKMSPTPFYSPLNNAMLAVDTFLVITGTLIAYFFLHEIGTKQRKFNLLFYYFHRFIRVYPALLMAVLLGATLSSRSGDGPLWPVFVLRHQEMCRNNGWTNLLFLNNYVNTDHQCLSYTWYLCVDMHLYFLSPLVLFPLLRSRRFAHLGLPVLILTAITVDFLVSFLHKLPAGSLLTRDLRTEDNYRLEYTPTHTRAAPWLVGVGLGYILHTVRGTKVKLSQVTVWSCWVGATVVMLTSVFGMSYFHQDSRVIDYNVLQSAVFTSTHRVAWALGIAWLIFACETGYGGVARRFLSWRVFQPLGRLTFGLYMVHGCVQYTIVASLRGSTYFRPMSMVRDVFGELIMALCQAVLLALCVEAPFIQLEKIILRAGLKSSVTNLQGKEKELITKDSCLPPKTDTNTIACDGTPTPLAGDMDQTLGYDNNSYVVETVDTKI